MNANALFRSVKKNPVAKRLRNDEFRQRIVPLAKVYNRKKFRKFDLMQESY
jgi:hypothetical protein